MEHPTAIHNRRRALLASMLAASALTAVGPAPAFAQSGALEEVIVTARKREETLQETPIAVSAFNSDMLRAAQIINVDGLTHVVPGLSRREGRKTADLNIRGIGTRAPGIEAEPAVGVYVDSVYIPRNDAQLVDVLEMESVQVLRGPQGTLFGKNTAGGAILLTTKKPGPEMAGFASTDIGNLDRHNFRGGISGPLSIDGLYGGIQADYQKEDGYRDDLYTGVDYGNIDRHSVLAQLRYESKENFTGDLMLFYGEVEENEAPTNCVQSNPAAAIQTFTAPGNATPYGELCEQSNELVDDEKVIFDRTPLEFNITNYMAGLTLAWDLEPVTVKSITGYLYQEDIMTGNLDVDSTNLFTLGNVWEPLNQMRANGIDPDDENRTFFSQEFQFLGDAFDEFLTYTVGAFYSYEKIDDAPFGATLGPGGFIGTDLGDGTVRLLPASISFRSAQVREFKNTSMAVFGQTILNLSDMWQLTLGARYTQEEKKAGQVNYVAAEAFPVGNVLPRAEFDALENYLQGLIVNPENPNPGGEDKWNEFNPAVTLAMFTPPAWSNDFFDGGMLYTSASSGFKAGGFTPFGTGYVAFDPEDLWSYEFGYKLDFWDHRARINGAFYYSEYDDIQITVTRTFPRADPTLPPATENGIVNAGQATIKGAELEFSLMPLDGLLLAVSASYIDAGYDEFLDLQPPDTTIDRGNEDFAYVPEQTYTVTAQYEWLTDWGYLTPQLNYYYVSSQFIGLDAVSAAADEAYLDSYDLWRFRLAFQPSAVEGLEVAGYVKNLTDEKYFGAGIASINGVGSVALVPGRQRTYGVELRYNW
jgi:iron complex outermembrane receptor protein